MTSRQHPVDHIHDGILLSVGEYKTHQIPPSSRTYHANLCIICDHILRDAISLSYDTHKLIQSLRVPCGQLWANEPDNILKLYQPMERNQQSTNIPKVPTVTELQQRQQPAEKAQPVQHRHRDRTLRRSQVVCVTQMPHGASPARDRARVRATTAK